MRLLKTYTIYSAIICVMLAISGCSKEEQVNITGNPNPIIKLVSVSSKQLKQFKDSLVITLEYTDGDGDIGETNPDINDLEIKDLRLSKADYYFVKPLTPPDAEIKVKGLITVQMKNTFYWERPIAKLQHLK